MLGHRCSGAAASFVAISSLRRRRDPQIARAGALDTVAGGLRKRADVSRSSGSRCRPAPRRPRRRASTIAGRAPVDRVVHAVADGTRRAFCSCAHGNRARARATASTGDEPESALHVIAGAHHLVDPTASPSGVRGGGVAAMAADRRHCRNRRQVGRLPGSSRTPPRRRRTFSSERAQHALGVLRRGDDPRSAASRPLTVRSALRLHGQEVEHELPRAGARSSSVRVHARRDARVRLDRDLRRRGGRRAFRFVHAATMPRTIPRVIPREGARLHRRAWRPTPSSARPEPRAPTGIDHRPRLNVRSTKAATALSGPVLVVAGAGSGKTRTLVFRVARLVDAASHRPILLLTFTRRAAREMLRRARPARRRRARRRDRRDLPLFAEHDAASRARSFGWPERFTILDRGDSETPSTRAHAPRARQNGAPLPAQTDARDHLLDRGEQEPARRGPGRARPRTLIDDVGDIPALPGRVRGVQAGARAARLRRPDPPARPAARRRREFRERLRTVYRYVMVDEYQDTNHLRADIVEALCAPDGNVMAVGDDAQSIYGFRGADFPQTSWSSTQRFPGARLVTLEENYRSSQAILDVTNAVIAQASERYAKTLFTRRAGGARSSCRRRTIAGRASSFASASSSCTKRVPAVEIAVLFRSSFHLVRPRARAGALGVPVREARRLPLRRDGARQGRDRAPARGRTRARRGIPGIASCCCSRASDRSSRPGGRVARGGGSRDRGAGQFPGAPDARTRHRHLIPARRLPRRSTRGAPDHRSCSRWSTGTAGHRRVHRDDAPAAGCATSSSSPHSPRRYRELAPMLADAGARAAERLGRRRYGGRTSGEMLTLSTVRAPAAKGSEWHSVFVLSVAGRALPSAYSVDEDEIEEERRLSMWPASRAREKSDPQLPTIVHERALGPVVARCRARRAARRLRSR